MVALTYAGDLCLGPFLFVCLAAARRVQLFAARSYEAKLRVPPGKYRSRGRFGWWLVGIAGLTLGAVWSGLPMHAAFCLSRPGLDALADEALADPANAHRLAGRRAGVYRVQGVEVIGRTVVLCVDRAEGTYGFARVPGAASDYISNVNNGYPSESPHHHGDFPEYRYPRDLVGERMAGDWFVVFSGYWRIKLGWS
jgi:hypothetical protein